MEKEKDIPFGKCPVCGEGDIIRTEFGYQCNARKESNECKCKFTIHKVQHGVELDDKLVKELITKGHTRELQMINKIGQPFNASFVIKDGKVCIELTSHYMRGKCPVCGGRVLKTSRGYACENNLLNDQKCSFKMAVSSAEGASRTRKWRNCSAVPRKLLTVLPACRARHSHPLWS